MGKKINIPFNQCTYQAINRICVKNGISVKATLVKMLLKRGIERFEKDNEKEIVLRFQYDNEIKGIDSSSLYKKIQVEVSDDVAEKLATLVTTTGLLLPRMILYLLMPEIETEMRKGKL